MIDLPHSYAGLPKTHGKCTDKPDVQQAATVGDGANHALVLVHQKCTWTMPIEMEGLKSTTYEVTIVSDARGS
jgi:hypothetical protein